MDGVESGEVDGVELSICTSDPTVYLHSQLLEESPPADVPDDHMTVVSYDQQALSESLNELNLGELHFSLVYEASRMQLLIFVKEAINLPQSIGLGEARVYVSMCVIPEDFLWKRTKVVSAGLSPQFDEHFVIPDVLHHKLREYSICFFVMQERSGDVQGDQIIGRVVYALSDLRAGQRVETHVELF